MQGIQLRLYTAENRRHEGALVHEWLLARAHELGIGGGSAFRAIAGFGRHGRLHEERFFELAGEVPVLVECYCSAAQADALLARVREARLDVFVARVAADFEDLGA